MTLPNMVNMVIRNTRTRYPVSSEQINDSMDEVYYTLSEMLGYQNEAGDIAISGVLRELLTSLDSDMASQLGSSASGVAEAYSHASGTISNKWNSIYSINYSIGAMINNPIS